MNRLLIHQIEVLGLDLNEKTGCAHYHGPLDIIAIKFKCCERYYACYSCHLQLAAHPIERWTSDELHTKAILCGRCGHELTIREYVSCQSQCPQCHASFNPGCRLHWDLYFEL